MSSVFADAVAQAKQQLQRGWERDDADYSYATDPVAYLEEVLRFGAWSKQREIIESVRDHKRTAVRSAHGTGKTAIAARTGLWFLNTYPRSRVITTAPTWAQVETLLWREIHVAHHAAGGRIGGKLSATRLDLGPDWFAIGWSTDRPERFQGQHAEHLLLIVDEASGVDEGLFEAAQGFLTAAGARLLLIGNPTQLSGEFFDAFHTKRASYNLIAVSAFDTPAFTGEEVPPEVMRALPTTEWVEEMRALYTEESPLWDVRVLGDFPSTADNSIMALGGVERAQQRQRERELPVIVGCDVARFGSDETVIAVRRGPNVRIEKVMSGRDTMATTGELVRVAKELFDERLDWARIVVDDVGLGGGVTDRLMELRRQGALGATRIIPFNGAQASRAKNDYPNRRSEVWFEFAERIEELDLDTDEQLAADLVAPRYRLDSRGRRVVEPKEETKKRLGRSPDRADAVLLTFAIPDRPPSGPVDDDIERKPDPLEKRRRARHGADFPDPEDTLGYDSAM